MFSSPAGEAKTNFGIELGPLNGAMLHLMTLLFTMSPMETEGGRRSRLTFDGAG